MFPSRVEQGQPDPTVIVWVWPHNAFLNLFVLIVLGYLVVSYWRWTRPCDTCDESPRENCRCKGREY